MGTCTPPARHPSSGSSVRPGRPPATSGPRRTPPGPPPREPGVQSTRYRRAPSARPTSRTRTHSQSVRDVCRTARASSSSHGSASSTLRPSARTVVTRSTSQRYRHSRAYAPGVAATRSSTKIVELRAPLLPLLLGVVARVPVGPRASAVRPPNHHAPALPPLLPGHLGQTEVDVPPDVAAPDGPRLGTADPLVERAARASAGLSAIDQVDRSSRSPDREDARPWVSIRHVAFSVACPYP